MAEILHEVLIKASPSRVYRALTEQREFTHWLTTSAITEPVVNTISEFTFDHGQTILRAKIVKLLPSRTIIWHCVSGFPEWIDTQITFELKQLDKGTLLLFSHRGWRSTAGTFAHFNFNWARYLMSLKTYLEKGKGFPIRG